MDDVILQKGKRDTDTVRGIREKGSKIERVSEKERAKGRQRDREKKRERGGGGVFMDVVSENVEMLRLLWTSIQWKEHDGKSALAVTGLLYKSWGVTPMLFWLQILMSVWLCRTFTPFSLVYSPFTTGNAIQFPFLLLRPYLSPQTFYSTTLHIGGMHKRQERFPLVMLVLQ